MKIEIKGDSNSKQLIKMLAWIELLGNVGHSASFKVFADGDGSTRWKFKFEDEEQQKEFDLLRKELCKVHIDGNKDIEYFSI
jgi:hypothetical protein